MSELYILDGREAKRCHDVRAWGRWFESAERRVARTAVGDVDVSTVFLGMDHAFGESPNPLLFETMVFGGSLDQRQERCSTWDEAEAQHVAMVAEVKAALQ